MAQRGPTRPTAHIEESIGFVGMFGVLFLGVTVFCELTGRPALGWALTLLVCVLGVVALDRWRVAVLRRTAPQDGTGASVPCGIGAAPAVAPVHTSVTDPTGRRPRPGADGRVHQHAGWDEVAPAARRPARPARVPQRRADRGVPAVAARRGGPDAPADVTHGSDG
ncbi:hypothetical protein [Curtobacterium flaccumfaciens]|uniref:hypothetical protein n=1 Tax=Curtobacterium flaccumfaciens TaxID=2035 RepID=UPI00126692D1|nr:hypothetical protein [Curtobacterium flaccumfaciens]MBT1667499.1 hypothetical protein [Curtobacterium flaccumfaciens pv. flaccumfaciens]QFS80126.1 hypothetical protein GBG65_13730 [Curtobacterium flaccumfaciens pv. flaccumfaciens]